VDGFNGTTSAISGGFSNVNIILGSTSSNADSLTGINTASVFDLAAGTYTDTVSATTLQYIGVETLIGGSAADTFLINGNTTHNLNGGAGNDVFVFNSNNQLTGWINGGLGSDTLNYQAYTEAVTVSFAAGTATAVSAGISGIENFLGSATASNTIYGDDNDNILVGGASNDTFYGLGGNDTYILSNGWGQDTIIEYANQGNDTLDFSGVTDSGITFTFNGTTITVGYGSNLATTNSFVENYIGTGLDDTFVFST
jgi:Ca2+-binding RTX toxin-like protein